jgi:hypothetical protein
MRLRNLFRGKVILGLVTITLSDGCSRTLELHEPPLAQARIGKLAGLCSKYVVKQKKKPASVEELKAWVKKLSKSEVDELRIEDPEIAFISPRDNQLFVLVRSGGSGPGDVLAYERIGEGGKHYIVTAMGASFELEHAELQRRVPSAQ